MSDQAPPLGRILFDNGGTIDVHWVKDGWVGYAVYHPRDGDEPTLHRKTIENWHISLAATREKIAKEQVDVTDKT
jgi:hypothetical protein